MSKKNSRWELFKILTHLFSFLKQVLKGKKLTIMLFGKTDIPLLCTICTIYSVVNELNVS